MKKHFVVPDRGDGEPPFFGSKLLSNNFAVTIFNYPSQNLAALPGASAAKTMRQAFIRQCADDFNQSARDGSGSRVKRYVATSKEIGGE